jgi:hypothetical protein
MGGGGSQTINQRFNLTSTNQSIFEQITKNQSRASASQASVQNLTIQFKNMEGCTVDLSQKVDASTISSSELSAETTAEIKNAITNEMQAAVQAQIEKATEMGNMQFGDKQNVNQEVLMEIENIVENTITTENLNEAIAEQVTIQGQTLQFGNCKDSDIVLGQDIVAKAAASAVLKTVSSAIAQSTLLNEIDAAAGASQKSENTGFADIIGTFFEGLTGPMKYGIIACVVCCCLLVLVMIVIGLSPAGQSATQNLGRAGANRLGGPYMGGMRPRSFNYY